MTFSDPRPKFVCFSFLNFWGDQFFFLVGSHGFHGLFGAFCMTCVIRKNEGVTVFCTKVKFRLVNVINYNKKNCLHILERITFFDDKPTKSVRRVSFSGVSGISYCSNTCSDRSGLSSAATYDRFGHV